MGKGNVAVVSPPATYDNMVHPEEVAAAGGNERYGQAPPDYSHGSDDHCFSDAAVRRGKRARLVEGAGGGTNRTREERVGLLSAWSGGWKRLSDIYSLVRSAVFFLRLI